MNKQEIQSILNDALEDEIPASEINLWTAIQADLVTGKHIQGETMNTTQPRRRPQLAFAVTLSLALLAAILLTPQGQAFAQSVLEFFARTEATSYPLEDSQITPLPDMLDEPVPTALPPAPLISADEAQVQLGFTIAELPTVPPGLDYLGVRIYGNAASVEYQAQGGGGHLIITQSRNGFNQSEFDKVQTDAIVPVKIGELDGEYAQGTFVIYPGDEVASWNSEAAILRLRWMNNGIWYEIAKFGDVPPIKYLNMAGLIELAESLMDQP